VTVLRLEEVRVEPDPGALVTAGISRPAAGEPVGAPTFVVRGWALGDADRALAVEIRADSRLVRVAPVREPTPEIARAHPDRPGATHCGFLTRVHVGDLEPSSDLRLEAVLANGTRAAIGTIALAPAAAPRRERQRPRGVPSIRDDVERLVLQEAERASGSHELDRAALLSPPGDRSADPRVGALDEVDLEGRTVLDLSGGPGHVARAARARGAALVDSVHLDDDLADLARLLDLYHRTTRVFVHDSLEGLERTYDVVLMLDVSPVAPERLEPLTGGIVVRS
jgi:hypothetical protein